jgi:polyisoprenoid-binding protein YceI
MNKHVFRAVVLLWLVALPAAVAARFTTPSGTSVEFTVHGPAGMIIVGSSSTLELSEHSGTLSFEVPIATLQTSGPALEGKRMRSVLEANRFPTAVLMVVRSQLNLPDEGEAQSGNVTGQLTLHGVTRPVSVHYRAQNDDATYAVTGHLDIRMTDFGITPPSYLGLSVQNAVSIDVRFRTTDDN